MKFTEDIYESTPELRTAPTINAWESFKTWLNKHDDGEVVGDLSTSATEPLAYWLKATYVDCDWRITGTMCAIAANLPWCSNQGFNSYRLSRKFSTFIAAMHAGHGKKSVTKEQCLLITRVVDRLGTDL